MSERRGLPPNHLLRRARLSTSSPSGSGRPLSRQELADAVNAHLAQGDASAATLDANHIGKLERGEHRWPNERRREAFRHVLNAETDAELGFYIVRGMKGTASPHAFQPWTGAPGDEALQTPPRVIHALGVAAAGHGADLGTAADTLQELIAHFAQTANTLPPASVYNDLLSIRSYAGQRLHDASSSAPRRLDLVVAAGWLSNLMAVVTSYTGDHAAALVWCRDAERHSHDTGHPELAGWAALTRAMIAYYHGQARTSATIASRGQTVAPSGTVAHAKLAAHEMRARAMVGDIEGMTDAKRRAADAIARLPSNAATTGVFSINRDQDPPYTATSLLLVNSFAEAAAATRRIIDNVYRPHIRDRAEQPSNYARTMLVLALALAGLGRVDEAADAGQVALDGARPVWPTMVLAHRLDQVLKRDFGDAPETADYHTRYQQAANGSKLQDIPSKGTR